MRRKVRKMVESRLYAYPFYKLLIKEMQDMSLTKSVVEVGGKGGKISDPTGEHVMRLSCNSIYQYACRTVKQIEDVLPLLTPEERKAIRLTYFEDHLGWTPERIAREIHLSRAQYYRVRWSAVKKFAQRMGLT